MAIALTLPALALLFSLPGISGLPHLPGLGAFKRHPPVVVPAVRVYDISAK